MSRAAGALEENNPSHAVSSVRGSAWTTVEDATLIQMHNNKVPWDEISSSLPGRSVGACQSRWRTFLKDLSAADTAQIIEAASAGSSEAAGFHGCPKK